MREIDIWVAEDADSQRIDKYLSMVVEDLSRSRIASLIEEGSILADLLLQW